MLKETEEQRMDEIISTREKDKSQQLQSRLKCINKKKKQQEQQQAYIRHTYISVQWFTFAYSEAVVSHDTALLKGQNPFSRAPGAQECWGKNPQPLDQ